MLLLTDGDSVVLVYCLFNVWLVSKFYQPSSCGNVEVATRPLSAGYFINVYLAFRACFVVINLYYC